MNTFKITRQDWSLTNFVLIVVLIVSAIPLIGGLADWISGSPLQIETGAVVEAPVVNDPKLSPDVTGVYTGDAIYSISNASLAQWLHSLVVPLITLIVAIVCLWQVRQLIKAVHRDDPFNTRAHLAIRVIGLTLFSYGLFAPVIDNLMMAMITTQMRGGEFNFVVSFDASQGWPILVGLVVGVIGEAVFGRGRQLVEETEGLI